MSLRVNGELKVWASGTDAGENAAGALAVASGGFTNQFLDLGLQVQDARGEEF